MKKYIFILFILSYSINVRGQQDSIIDNKFCIKIAPFSLLNTYIGSSIRVGAEYKLKDKLSNYSELGCFLDFKQQRNAKGLLLKSEFKRYLNKNNLTSGVYLSGELFLKHQSYKTQDSIELSPTYLKNYSISSNVACITIKYGELNVLKNGFAIDCFIGLGIRLRNIVSSLSKEENGNIQAVGDYSSNVATNKSGNFIRPNIDAGIKIGYSVR